MAKVPSLDVLTSGIAMAIRKALATTYAELSRMHARMDLVDQRRDDFSLRQ